MPPFAPGDVNAFSRPLDVAFSHLAVEETPGHPNRGKMVDKYIEFCGLDPDADAYHWCCAAVVFWCHKGGLLWVPKTPKVKRLWELLADRRSAVPRIGDAFIHLKPDGTGHVGLVASFTNIAVHTVEGNSNRAGSRTGNAVVRHMRDRRDGYIKGYIKLDGQARLLVA